MHSGNHEFVFACTLGFHGIAVLKGAARHCTKIFLNWMINEGNIVKLDLLTATIFGTLILAFPTTVRWRDKYA